MGGGVRGVRAVRRDAPHRHGHQGPDFHVDLARAEYNIGVLYAHVGRFALGRAGAAGHFGNAQAILKAALKEAQDDAADLRIPCSPRRRLPSAKPWSRTTSVGRTTLSWR